MRGRKMRPASGRARSGSGGVHGGRVDLRRILVRSFLSGGEGTDSARDPGRSRTIFFMETKEHLFFVTAILAFLLPIAAREKLDSNAAARRLVLSVAGADRDYGSGAGRRRRGDRSRGESRSAPERFERNSMMDSHRFGIRETDSRNVGLRSGRRDHGSVQYRDLLRQGRVCAAEGGHEVADRS